MTLSPNAPILALALAAACAFLPSASAQSTATESPAPAGVAQQVVQTDGRTTEEVRADIQAAARKVCQFTSTHSSITPWEDGRCRRQAEQQALAQLDPAPSQLAGSQLATRD